MCCVMTKLPGKEDAEKVRGRCLDNSARDQASYSDCVAISSTTLNQTLLYHHKRNENEGRQSKRKRFSRGEADLPSPSENSIRGYMRYSVSRSSRHLTRWAIDRVRGGTPCCTTADCKATWYACPANNVHGCFSGCGHLDESRNCCCGCGNFEVVADSRACTSKVSHAPCRLQWPPVFCTSSFIMSKPLFASHLTLMSEANGFSPSGDAFNLTR